MITKGKCDVCHNDIDIDDEELYNIIEDTKKRYPDKKILKDMIIMCDECGQKGQYEDSEELDWLIAHIRIGRKKNHLLTLFPRKNDNEWKNPILRMTQTL